MVPAFPMDAYAETCDSVVFRPSLLEMVTFSTITLGQQQQRFQLITVLIPSVFGFDLACVSS